ncbi:MAG: MCE family protein [Archangium sp.]|nr:MCE family protein [Archangium sp.]
MSTPTNHWKLGLFVVAGVVGCLALFVFIGGRSLKKETVPYKTYFDESVQGLELGSPVKFRGVSIGNVSEIDLAGDKRHVEVTYALGVKVLDSLGLSEEHVPGVKTKLVIPDNLRAQLISSGITGVKVLQLDFFDSKTTAAPIELPFEVPENHIAAVPSTMKNLEDSVVNAVDRFPELAQQLVQVLTQTNAVITQIAAVGIPEKMSQTLTLLNRLLEQLNIALVAIAPGALSADARQALKSLHTVLENVAGDKGLAASVQRTSEAVGAMAANAKHVGPAMEDALKDVQGAAQSVQRLAEALELDPDMLVKGRARRTAK